MRGLLGAIGASGVVSYGIGPCSLVGIVDGDSAGILFRTSGLYEH